MGWDAPWHWVVLAVIVIALFGYKKMPDAARSLGRSLRIFKTEIKGMSDDDKARDARDAVTDAGAKPAVEAAPQTTAAPVAPVVAETPAPVAPAEVQTPVTTPATSDDKPAGSAQ